MGARRAREGCARARCAFRSACLVRPQAPAIVREAENQARAHALLAADSDAESHFLAHGRDKVESHARGGARRAPGASGEPAFEHARHIGGGKLNPGPVYDQRSTRPNR